MLGRERAAAAKVGARRPVPLASCDKIHRAAEEHHAGALNSIGFLPLDSDVAGES